MTTNHQHSPGHHQHAHGSHNDHQHSGEEGMAQMLDLDALLLKEHLQQIFEWTAGHHQNPRSIMDLGAGTGTGTLGLARTFPEASVLAVDQSEFMLGRLAATADEHGLSPRLSTAQVDLDQSWPEATDVDLVWAASSMHHMGNPARVFEHIASTLSADGMLVVMEMDKFPRYLPRELGFGVPGLEERCHEAADSASWNAHPDWAGPIHDAGMEIIEQRTFDYAIDHDQQLIARAAHRWLSRMHTALQDSLSVADLQALEMLLDDDGPQSVFKRNDLAMRGSRTVWAARISQG